MAKIILSPALSSNGPSLRLRQTEERLTVSAIVLHDFRVAKIILCPTLSGNALSDGCARQRNGLRFRLSTPNFRVAKIWALWSLVGWPRRSWPVDRQSAWIGTGGRRMRDKRQGELSPMSAIFSRRENHPLPYPFQQCPKLTAAPVRGTAYGLGYQPQDFRDAKIMGVAVAGWLAF